MYMHRWACFSCARVWLAPLVGVLLVCCLSACSTVRYAPFSTSDSLLGREPAMEHGAAALPASQAYIYSIREGGLSPSSGGGAVKGGGGCGCQ